MFVGLRHTVDRVDVGEALLCDALPSALDQHGNVVVRPKGRYRREGCQRRKQARYARSPSGCTSGGTDTLVQGLVVFFPEPGHEAKTRFSLDPVTLVPKLGDDLVDGLPTDTCLVADLGSCEIPGAARPYGFEHSGYVVSLTPHHPLSRQGSFALDSY